MKGEGNQLSLSELFDGERLLTIRDLEVLTGTGETTIYEAMKRGVFPRPLRVVGKSNRWLWSEVRKHIEERRRQRDEKILEESMTRRAKSHRVSA